MTTRPRTSRPCGNLTTRPVSVTSVPNVPVNAGAEIGSACSVANSAPAASVPASSGATADRRMSRHHTPAAAAAEETASHVHADNTDPRPSAIPAANAAAIQTIGGSMAPPHAGLLGLPSLPGLPGLPSLRATCKTRLGEDDYACRVTGRL